ncbi:THO complex subunit 5A [Silene latifolia]|uniref:THO complex subunit 5A n=1 Tax=Silene latifolia TaxID=37657 RepID=UPI003D7736D6
MDVKMEDAAVGTATAALSTEKPEVAAAQKNPQEMLKCSKDAVEDIVSKMLSLKKDGNPKSQLPELVTQMFLHFVSLRQANRMILIEEDRVKAETDRAKAPVDSTTLQFHNLMYEKSHYLKAIKACTDFKSKYPDIQLVSEEEFFREAPEEFKGTATSSDSHNLMLKRLNYELFQRKELCKLREKLEQQKKSLSETIASRKKFLSSLPSHLKSLKKASLPAQNQLGVLHTKKLKQLHAAELLPPPLYIIYSQFMAQKEAFGENIELEVLGSLKDAQAFVRRQTCVSTIQENTKADDDVPDEEDDGQRRRKRPRKVVGKDNIEAAGIYQVHPLKIILHIYDDEAADRKPSKLITLKFEYLFKLNVVCVGIDGSNEGPEKNILCNLFPDDNGLELPLQSAKLLLGDGAVFDELRSMRPYKWVQHLAGIDFLPEVSPLMTVDGAVKSENGKDSVTSGLSVYRQQNRVQTVVERVRSRKKAQLALAEQLDFLLELKWPPLNSETVPWASHKHLCSFRKWSPLVSSSIQVASLPVVETESLHDSMDVSMDGKTGSAKDEAGAVTEDGELPSLNQPSGASNNARTTSNPKQDSGLDHPKSMTLMAKSVAPSVKTVRTQSFRKYEEDIDLMLDSDSEVDDTTKMEKDIEGPAIERKSWVDYGSREFSLCLIRNKDVHEGNAELEAKIKISTEYPLRPPFFKLHLLSQSSGGNCPSKDHSEWHNELCAMEAEVNLHILKMVPSDQQNYILSHQVHCLAMLFDLYLNEASEPSEGGRCNSVIDVGLCKPVSGGLTTRSFRGRDRRRMISWKGMECTPGYPF